jgi:hypothetical protein
MDIVAARMTLHVYVSIIVIFILVSSFIASDIGDAAPHRACSLLHPLFVVGKVKDVEWNLAGEEDHR